MSTPCNSLNAQFIKVSQLASYSSIKDADKLMIVENTGGTLYSRNSTLSNLRDYILEEGTSGFPTTSYYSNTDTFTLIDYVAGTKSLSFTHGLGSVPSLVRTVLVCVTNDGFFSSGDEIDVSACYNENSRPLCCVRSNSTSIRVMIPTFTYAKAYTWNGSSNGLVNLVTSRWSVKVYAWK